MRDDYLSIDIDIVWSVIEKDLPGLEENILKFWKENKIFEESVESKPKDKPYKFYDGPPFIT